MAGYRLTLKKLAKKYGVDIKGATYTQVVQAIVQDNVARASKQMGKLSNRRMKQAFADSIKDGIVSLPEYAIPNVTVRKGADDGKMITDTLRDTLSRGLRKAITDNPNDTEQAIAQMQAHVKDTFTTYTTSHAKMIAVTEVRSSVDLSKAEYVRELIARNPHKLRVTKKWIHHDHLVKIPRPTHKAIDGEVVLFNQPFSIGLMYPHDPSAPASEVIGCQCGYQVSVEEMAINEAWKSLYHNLKVYKAYRVGTRRERADGYTYEKQSDGSWERVKEQNDGIHGKQGTDNQGQSAGGQGNSGRIPRQSELQGMDTGLPNTGNNQTNTGMGSVGNKALERWVAIDDFRKHFDSSPTRIFDNGVVETNNKELFSKQFMKLRDENPLGLKVSARTPHDLRGAKMFMSPDGSYTCAVTKDGVLTAVCGTVHKGDYDFIDHSLKPLLKQAIQSGAKKADCYGKDLLSLYEAVGYKVIGQAKWNPKYWNENKDNSPTNETDPMKVFPEENGQPNYYYLAYTDETPEIQDVSDWEWEDIEKLQNSFAKKSPVAKASAGINPATGKPWQIGDTKVRPDGTKWVKTGTFSWAKAGTQDAKEAEKKTDKDGDGKKEWQELEGQSSKDAEDILGVYGEKGLYQLTKNGLINLLHAHGVDNPQSLKWAEKVEKVKEIAKEIQEHGSGTTIKTQGKEEFTEEDYHILHNNDLGGDASSLENDVIHTRNGNVTLKFTEDGGLTDQTYDELMQKVDPIAGGHWGSAKTNNDTALSVALVNAPDWKPIDQMKNGILAKYDQQLTDTMYEHCLVKGIGLRKYAQNALKHPDMSREKIPNFFRGMTVDASQYEQILAGEVDTIELTGCTAVSSFEEVADQYASSRWTRSFGAGRRSIKLVIERDDYMDNSIGMFHNNTKGFGHGNRNLGFELLTGSPSFYIKSVQKGGDFDVDKSTDAIVKNPSENAQENYDSIKDIDIASLYNPNDYWKFEVKDPSGHTVIQGDNYWRVMRELSGLRSKALVQDLNKRITDWEKQYYKSHVQDFFGKVRNGSIRHANNRELRRAWQEDMQKEWEKSDLYKEWKEYQDYNPYIDSVSIDRSELPDEDERKKIDNYYGNPDYIKREAKDYLNNPLNDLDLTWRNSIQDQYDRWKEAQNSKKGTLTMKMFLDKRKPLEKSYKTQIDKTADEYKEYEDYYVWRNTELLDEGRLAKVEDKLIRDFLKKYDIKEEELGNAIRTDDYGRKTLNMYNLPYRTPFSDIDQDNWIAMRRILDNIDEDRPRLGYNGNVYIRPSTQDEDNPFLTPALRKSPFFQKSKDGDFSDKRYEQLSNIRRNYENAKRDNEAVAKYDLYNTSPSEISNQYDATKEKYRVAREAVRGYIADKWIESLGDRVSDNTKEDFKEAIVRERLYDMGGDHRNEYLDFQQKFENTDDAKSGDYKALKEAQDNLSKEVLDVGNAYRICQEYNDKLADMHKSSRPLEVHVVCGRGKKSMTAGSDDQLEEQDNDNNQ